jgi:sulfonate transport system ATP-binding protein
VALLGGSGCGKSTLVRLVAGLERADGGVVRVGDHAVSRPLEHVGLMFQEPRLLPWLDAAANVAFGLADDVRGAGESDRRVRELLLAVGLPEAGALLPHQLSGGMAQRVALARALARAPDVRSSTSPGSVDALTGPASEPPPRVPPGGMTVLLVTHDLEEALRVAGGWWYLVSRLGSTRSSPGPPPGCPTSPGSGRCGGWRWARLPPTSTPPRRGSGACRQE